MKTINRTWFKNQLRKGNLLVKCKGKYTDDYAFDAASNFFVDSEYSEASPDLFDDWYLSVISIYGEKESVIHVCFANCEYYDFKINTNKIEIEEPKYSEQQKNENLITIYRAVIETLASFGNLTFFEVLDLAKTKNVNSLLSDFSEHDACSVLLQKMRGKKGYFTVAFFQNEKLLFVKIKSVNSCYTLPADLNVLIEVYTNFKKQASLQTSINKTVTKKTITKKEIKPKIETVNEPVCKIIHMQPIAAAKPIKKRKNDIDQYSAYLADLKKSNLLRAY